MTRWICFFKTPLLVSSAAFLFLDTAAAARDMKCESLFYGSLSYPAYYEVLGARVHNGDVGRVLLEPARTWDDFKFRAALAFLAGRDLAWVEHLVEGRVRFVLYRRGEGIYAVGPQSSHQVDLRADLFETMASAGLVYSKKLDRWFFK